MFDDNVSVGFPYVNPTYGDLRSHCTTKVITPRNLPLSDRFIRIFSCLLLNLDNVKSPFIVNTIKQKI